jgi:predicted nucleic acid-binding protein
MSILIDTNILLRSVQPSHPMHAMALHAVELLLAGKEPLCITIQNVAEFWNSATRPVAQNGLGFTITRAAEDIGRLEYFFEILSESDASYAAWKTLVITNRVSGAQVHDARLAAIMKTNGIQKIVTFNVADLMRFSHVQAVHSQDVSLTTTGDAT